MDFRIFRIISYGLVTTFILFFLIIGWYNAYILFPDEDGFYNEIVNLKLQFSSQTEFQLILPTIKVDGDLSPAFQQLHDEIQNNISIPYKISQLVLNGTIFFEITGISDEIIISERIDLPKINDNIGYEENLFDHYLVNESERGDFRQNYYTYLLINATNTTLELDRSILHRINLV